jgi:hypothetical protein
MNIFIKDVEQVKKGCVGAEEINSLRKTADGRAAT